MRSDTMVVHLSKDLVVQSEKAQPGSPWHINLYLRCRTSVYRMYRSSNGPHTYTFRIRNLSIWRGAGCIDTVSRVQAFKDTGKIEIVRGALKQMAIPFW
ncbi:hypothetical protein KCU78_g84, partial [Aureobasidium melanogenum]